MTIASFLYRGYSDILKPKSPVHCQMMHISFVALKSKLSTLMQLCLQLLYTIICIVFFLINVIKKSKGSAEFEAIFFAFVRIESRDAVDKATKTKTDSVL